VRADEKLTAFVELENSDSGVAGFVLDELVTRRRCCLTAWRLLPEASAHFREGAKNTGFERKSCLTQLSCFHANP